MADELSVSEQVEALTRSWNPPPEDHMFERVVGVATDPADVAATAHVDLDEVNKHITAGGSPTDSGVDAAQVSYDDDMNASGDSDGGDYDAKTVDELKDELRARDLPVSGSKQELIDRLEENDGGDA